MISAEQYQVLSRYAAGMPIDDIAKNTGIDRDDVAETVTRLTAMNRQRAGHLAREYDTARRNGTLTTPPAAKPATIDDLLDAAEATQVPRIVRAAGKIRALVGDLDAAVREAAREQKLRAEIEQLRAQLDKASGELRALSGKPARPAPARTAPPAGGPSTREIRQWAAAHGIECNDKGVLPQRVRDAYAAAHPDDGQETNA